MTREEIYAIVSSVEFRRFSNALRILRSLSSANLAEAGVTDFGEHAMAAFDRNEFAGFIMASDEAAAQIWRLIQARQPEDLK